MKGWQRYGAHSYWRRPLSDGSYLSVMPDGDGGAASGLRWVWRHRGPGYDRNHLGTCINAPAVPPARPAPARPPTATPPA
jgi:hypothetical protein